MPDHADTPYVTPRELYTKLDEVYDSLDEKIESVEEEVKESRIETARELANLKAWVRYWPVAAVIVGTVGGEQIAQALIR